MQNTNQSKKRSGTQGPTKKQQQGIVLDRTPGGVSRRQPQKPTIKASKQEIAYRIPDCVSHYLAAMIDPFQAPAGACVPADLFPLPSSKCKVFARGRMQLGLSGIGWVAVAATAMNNVACLQMTSASSVGSTATAFSSFTNLTTINCTQLPYPNTAFTNGNVLWRPVSLGVRVKYIGQLMDRNGVCIGFEDPDHQEFRSKSFDSLNSNPYTEVSRVGSDEWDMGVCSSGPVQPRELEFVPDTYMPGNGDFYLGIAVSGVAGDVYEVEMFEHVELIGTVVVNKTRSHAEPAMFGKVIEAAKDMSGTKPLQPKNAPTLWERFKGFVRESLPALVETGAGLAMSAFTKQSNPLLTDGGGRLLGTAANHFLPSLFGKPKSTAKMIMA